MKIAIVNAIWDILVQTAVVKIRTVEMVFSIPILVNVIVPLPTVWDNASMVVYVTRIRDVSVNVLQDILDLDVRL